MNCSAGPDQPFGRHTAPLRQSPPMRCRSMRATFAPSPAAPAAVTRPAVPPPVMTRLYRDAGSGLFYAAGWTLFRKFSLLLSRERTSGISRTEWSLLIFMRIVVVCLPIVIEIIKLIGIFRNLLNRHSRDEANRELCRHTLSINCRIQKGGNDRWITL
jgi:hypothetical protein